MHAKFYVKSVDRRECSPVVPEMAVPSARAFSPVPAFSPKAAASLGRCGTPSPGLTRRIAPSRSGSGGPHPRALTFWLPSSGAAGSRALSSPARTRFGAWEIPSPTAQGRLLPSSEDGYGRDDLRLAVPKMGKSLSRGAEGGFWRRLLIVGWIYCWWACYICPWRFGILNI